MARKSWDSLTPTYRHRLERGGVTRSQYESGASLKAARGHRATPEHGPKIQHTPKAPGIREQWSVGSPGPRGGGRPRASDIEKIVRQHITTPDAIVTVRLVAPISAAEELEHYKEEMEAETPTPKAGYKPPPGQQVYYHSATVNRSQLLQAMNTIAGLPKASQQAGLIQYVQGLTSGQFGQVSDVLSVSISNTKS